MKRKVSIMSNFLDSLRLGIDVGSTTTKAVVIDAKSREILFTKYKRHHAELRETVRLLLEEVSEKFPSRVIRAAICGSGGKPIAEEIGAYYVQEVVANAAAVRILYPQARTAIELGGQDAKIVFFHYDKTAGRIVVSDMRMNGSCSGGTGAFIDEVAALLRISAEGFEGLASKGSTVHDISGRCGVFAKTDIQSLLNQGGLREDIALSTFHAISKQTIGGLAQGLELKPPVIFEGGPLTFNKTLIRVFAERLNLRETDIICPKNPETIVACGTALSIDELFPLVYGVEEKFSFNHAIKALREDSRFFYKQEKESAKVYFYSDEEKTEWYKRHVSSPIIPHKLKPGDILRGYLGIDAGSTTTKFVLLDEDENVIDSFYSSNRGDPLYIVQQALIRLNMKYAAAGVTLDILGLGTTGYGELLFGKAFGADYHTVETVAHSAAAKKYVHDASFVLDVGGQDMKAIWMLDGIVTDIMLNEACSSGCGSFLENFAAALGIPKEEIAEAAFRAKHPAELGSRCTVFMNSSIITEQKNGKHPDEIMAGLCRAIIENIFTKVVRISNTASLGDKIVVQGGTFKNDAVLRALEQYLGKEVTRAPYSGEMGCIGAALLTKRHIEEHGYGAEGCSQFIGFDALEDFSYNQADNIRCEFCTNHCNRKLIKFSNGRSWVTGNRCERGALIYNGTFPKPERQTTAKPHVVPNMFSRREELLFKEYPFTAVSLKKDITIGLPRVLEFWDSMPFWTTFLHALGFRTKLSHLSTRKMFEQGIPFVASDTVCFPAKLVHGHISDLVKQGVDRIFMPMIMHMPAEGTNQSSNHVCAVVKGYPLVVRHSDNPEHRWSTAFDSPVFHWYKAKDREKQIINYMQKTFGVSPKESMAAFRQGEAALVQFRTQLMTEGQKIIDDARREGHFAIILAGRPYHNDSLVCHDLSASFTKEGIPVLTVDSLPEIRKTNLRYTRAEITNNFHSRMLSGAMIAAESPELEYVQIVSFGCGHDAILSDEIIRIMRNTANKAPLILKLDEGDAAASLHIRIKSFLETLFARRAKDSFLSLKPLEDAYSAKFCKSDWGKRTVLVPNVSVAFCKLISAVLQKQGLRLEPMPLGGANEILLGKKYVHNDTCFPAQMVIGESLAALQSGKYKTDEVAVGMAKYQGDCRLSHYPALLRRALDEAGFHDVPIMSTDTKDSKNMHPGLKLGSMFEIPALWALTIMDILEELRRQIRPYELHKGETNDIFDKAIDDIAVALSDGIRPAIAAYTKAIDVFCTIQYERKNMRPLVFITGEYLVTFHPGSNFHIEEYLEQNGMEVILPRMTYVFRKDFLSRISEMKDFHVKYPLSQTLSTYAGEQIFDFALDTIEKIAAKHPLFVPRNRPPELADDIDPVMHRTFISGEGWLIPAEIREYANQGVSSFVILQPFGCLPNHICGRGVIKRIKEDFPEIQIQPLDLEPDTSFANVENRLQMLIMNEKSRQASKQIAPYVEEILQPANSKQPIYGGMPVAQSI